MEATNTFWKLIMYLVSTDRGFPRICFDDAYGKGCHIQQSSAIGEYDDAFDRPGTSFLWLGLNKAEPMVMARDAASVGVTTTETTGWVPYPVPEKVHTSVCMHLNREQVAGLIAAMQQWLDTGELSVDS